jgi:hypothetical protein
MELRLEILHTLVYIKILPKLTVREDATLTELMRNNKIAWDTVKRQAVFTHRNYNLVSVKTHAWYPVFTLLWILFPLLLTLLHLQLQLLQLPIMLLDPRLQQEATHQHPPQLLQQEANPWPQHLQFPHVTQVAVQLSTSNINASRAPKPLQKRTKSLKRLVLSV